MAEKNKKQFKIHPNSISSDKFINGLSDGSIFSYYADEYFLNYKKIIPWEIYNVERYVPTEREIIQYKNGAMWFREKGKWVYIGPFIVEPSVQLPVGPTGIGYMIIENDFIVS